MLPHLKYSSTMMLVFAIAVVVMAYVVGVSSLEISKSLKIIILVPIGFAAFALVFYLANASKSVLCPKCNYPLAARKSHKGAGLLAGESSTCVPAKKCSACGYDMSGK